MKHTNIIVLFCIIIVVLAGMAVRKRMSRRNRRKTRRGGREPFQTQQKGILGTAITACSNPPEKTTGYYRNGFCSTGPTDTGTHVVCAVVDQEFLDFTRSKGNDLITPQHSFPGLVPGDKWCLCALRWKEAYTEGKAPKIIPASTGEAATQYISKEILMNHTV